MAKNPPTFVNRPAATAPAPAPTKPAGQPGDIPVTGGTYNPVTQTFTPTPAPSGSTGSTGSTGGGPTGTITPTVQQTVTVPPAAFSAQQILENLLSSALGVSGLGNWAADLYNRGAKTTEIIQALRYGTDTSEAGKAARAAYLQAFPKMDSFIKDGIFAGENPELQYIQYRNTVREAAERYGVNPSLMSNDRVADYIAGRNSAAELVSRMSTAATAMATTPVETLAYLDSQYGVKGGDLMSFYLDTDTTEAELQKRYVAARIGGEAARQRFGIDKDYAEGLAERGVTADEAERGFVTAGLRRGFTAGKGDTVAERDLFEGSFGNADAAAAIERVATSRTNRFAGGGGYADSKQGVVGLGTA